MNNKNIKISSNKSFGIVFFIFFLILSIYPLFKDGNFRIWTLILSIVFLILGLLNSSILSPLNKIWFKFGILLGNFISPIVMGVIFFTVITPTSIIMKILNKDLLNLKKNDKKSYWIKKSEVKSKMKNQF
jgi:predicted membrane protein